MTMRPHLPVWDDTEHRCGECGQEWNNARSARECCTD